MLAIVLRYRHSGRQTFVALVGTGVDGCRLAWCYACKAFRLPQAVRVAGTNTPCANVEEAWHMCLWPGIWSLKWYVIVQEKMMREWLAKLAGTKWQGKGELWLDPQGNSAEHYDCELGIENDAIHYSWLYENKTRNGSFTFDETGAYWVDSWHQQHPVQCFNVPKTWGIFALGHEYEVPDNPNWGWRSTLSERPDGSLVLQMTNIAPWGEEGRAVRMVFSRIQA